MRDLTVPEDETQQKDLNLSQILIIDDSRTARRIIKSILEKEGYIVHLASSGQEGISLLNESHPFDLVLLDIVMPEISGIDVARHLKGLNTNNYTPVIYLSSQVKEKMKLKYHESGGNGFISKPLDVNELLTKIANLLKFKGVSSHLRHLAEEDALTGH